MDNRKFQAAALATPPAAEASPSTGYPTDGNPSGGIPATIPGAFWFHQIGEELRAVLTAAGITPSDTDLTQLLTAIQALNTASKKIHADARSANTILASSDLGKLIVASGTWTQTLTAAATLGDGWWCFYRNDGTGVITIDPNGAEPIDGSATITLNPGEAIAITCDGSGFKTSGRKKRVKVGTFTRDMTAASGNQTISGLGFTPSRITFSGRTITGSPAGLVMGFTDGVNQQSIGQTQAGQMYIAGNYALGLPDSVAGAAVQSGSVLAAGMVYDQFTVAWTKTGAPAAGTASIIYKAEE